MPRSFKFSLCSFQFLWLNFCVHSSPSNACYRPRQLHHIWLCFRKNIITLYIILLLCVSLLCILLLCTLYYYFAYHYFLYYYFVHYIITLHIITLYIITLHTMTLLAPHLQHPTVTPSLSRPSFLLTSREFVNWDQVTDPQKTTYI
jgi:hypothetical protein